MAAKKKDEKDSKDEQDWTPPAHVPAAFEAVVETVDGTVELRADADTVTFGNTVFDRELWLTAMAQFRTALARVS